jgi:hypothetical protein
MSQQPYLHPVAPPDSGGPAAIGRQQARQRADKALPTDRMKMDRQIAVLHALGRLSGPRKESVNADGLSRAVSGIAPTTVILSNRFFEAAGWIVIPAKGIYAATNVLVEYTRRLATGTPAYAAEALRDPARQSWFWQVLEPHIADGRRLPVNDAVILLMRGAGASDGHTPMIRNLIAWLEHVGMISVRDQCIAAEAKTAEPAGDTAPGPPQPRDQGPAGTPAPAETGAKGEKPTAPGGGEPPATVVAFSFDVKVTTADLARLTPEQIRAFFEAVGAVMAVRQGD